jgi:glycosyltransferase involved in cell wall biosynthesis
MDVIGFNVIGPVSGKVGVSVHARYLIELLHANGHPVAIFDFDSGPDGPGPDPRFAEFYVNAPSELPYKINLFVFDIKTLCVFLSRHSDFVSRSDTLNTGIIVWELTVLPKIWKHALRHVDVMLCASDFIRATFDTCLPEALTLDAPCPVALPEGIAPARRELGLPEDQVLFISSLDLGSSPERKNPFATIDAFVQAFAGDRRAGLVIKLTNNRPWAKDAQQGLAKLKQHIRDNPQIHVLDQALSYPKVLALYDSCDVYVSLHRSEGLGLGLMEAMLLGKPVIATAWSGNMSYMDYTNSCPVRYTLVKVRSTHPNFDARFVGNDALWAEPDLSHASAWMRDLVEDSDRRDRIGKCAAAAMAEYNRVASQASFVDELKVIWQYRRFLPRHRGAVAVDQDQLWWAAHGQQPTLWGRTLRKLNKFYVKQVQWRLRK